MLNRLAAVARHHCLHCPDPGFVQIDAALFEPVGIAGELHMELGGRKREFALMLNASA
jgi:hypothetical protein